MLSDVSSGSKGSKNSRKELNLLKSEMGLKFEAQNEKFDKIMNVLYIYIYIYNINLYFILFIINIYII